MRDFVRRLIIFVLNLIADITVITADNVPANGVFVLATNHIGFLDIAMFHYVFDRYDMFIPVAEKWEKKSWARFFGKYLNFLFVDRYNADVRALRIMIDKMKEGNSLVIAPEGTRSRVGSLIPGKPGVAYLAARSGFPVVPVALVGTEDKTVFYNLKHFKKSKFILTAGVPFYLPPLPRENKDEALKQYTDEVMCQIAAILPERYRGVYADHPRLKELLEAQSSQQPVGN